MNREADRVSVGGCLVCGGGIVNSDTARAMTCAVCGRTYESNAACVNGHYICDGCHARGGVASITLCALQSESVNPVEIATRMMRSPEVQMHGPEHHCLVPAALLTAFHNAAQKPGRRQSLETATQRAKNVPGGVCGLWGSCGAAIGAGIFASVATGASPLSVEAWSLSNLLTSRCLEEISRYGGPRCCKRDTYLAIRTAVPFAAEHLGVTMEVPEHITCGFHRGNPECARARCPFYPKRPG